MSSFFVSSLSYFLVVLMVSIVLVKVVVGDLLTGGFPHKCCSNNAEKIIFTDFTKSYKTFCKALLLMYIITITKNTQFSKLAYKLSKNSCEYPLC